MREPEASALINFRTALRIRWEKIPVNDERRSCGFEKFAARSGAVGPEGRRNGELDDSTAADELTRPGN